MATLFAQVARNACQVFRESLERRPLLKILIAVDVTSSADEVVEAVVERSWPADTSALVLIAIEYAEIPEKVWREVEGKVDPVRKKMLSQAEDITAHAIDQLEESGIPAQATIKFDDPRFTIVKIADQWQADLIFIPAPHRTGPNLSVLSSVDEAVLRDAGCSVAIIRTTADRKMNSNQGGMKILVATDGSEVSQLAVHSVASRPWPLRTEVKIVTVLDPLRQLIEKAEPLVQVNSNAFEAAEKTLKEAKGLLSGAGLKIFGEVVNGNPREEILKSARKWNANLLVLGSSGRSGLKSLLFGSGAETIARQAPCSVEVIRRRENQLN